MAISNGRGSDFDPTVTLGSILATAMAGIERRTTQIPAPAETPKLANTPRVVTFDLWIRRPKTGETSLVPAIKALRNATGISLYDAKVAIEWAYTDGGIKNVKMTDTQFGNFIAAILADDWLSLTDVRMTNVRHEIAAKGKSVYDFT